MRLSGFKSLPFLGLVIDLRGCHASNDQHTQLQMVSVAPKSVSPAKRKSRATPLDAEERSLAEFNRLIAKAAPIATRETAAALNRFHRGIAAEIRSR